MPLKWVTKHMRGVTGPSLTLRGAGGQSLRHYGRILVALEVQENFVSLNFEVVDATRALLSVSAILDKGWRLDFDPDRPMIIKETMKSHLERRGGLYLFEGEVREVCDDKLENYEVCAVMPIENEQAMDRSTRRAPTRGCSRTDSGSTTSKTCFARATRRNGNSSA